MSILKQIKEAMPKDMKWKGDYKGNPYDYEGVGGFDEDNNMSWYRGDILYTRTKFKKIAEQRGYVKPYRFKRRDFKWIIRDNSFELMGILVLVDSDGKELVSSELTWLWIVQPVDWERWNGKWLLKNRGGIVYTNRRARNIKRWNYIKKRLNEK